MLNNIDFKDVGVRALKTFFQTFLSTIAVGLAVVDDFESVTALVVAAGAAGISAVWNMLVGLKSNK